MYEQLEKIDPVEAARNDMIEKVSVAGWKEALDEKSFTSRFAYRAALLVFTILCAYDSYPIILHWARKEFKDEINDILYPDSVPFSNVTICTPTYLKLSFITEHIRISERLAESFRRQTNDSIDELYEQLAIYLSISLTPKSFDSTYLRYFKKIARENPVLDDQSEFLHKASYQCEEILRRCWFNSDEFDCCSRAIRSLGDAGVCYILHLNSDSDNAFPSDATFRQTKPGPNGGLIVEASMNMNETIWMDEVVANGFVVFINAVPYNMFQSPLGVSSRAVSHIKVRPSRRHLAKKCIERGRLNKRHPFVYYDPEGFDCTVEAFLGSVRHNLQCDTPFYTYKPNASIVCTPDARYQSTVLWSDARLEASLEKVFVNSSVVGADTKLILEVLSKLEREWREALMEKNACPKHCTRWTYDSVSSFYYLEPSDNSSTLSNDRVFSRIHIFYDDMSYRQYDEVLEYPSYLAFCDFGNVLGLCWGMSIVSFFHVLYYVPRYLFVSRHRRGVGRILRRGNKVRDVAVSNARV